MTAAAAEAYRSAVRGQAEAARATADRAIRAWLRANHGYSVADAREYAKVLLGQLYKGYGDLSAEIAAELYDEIAARLGAGLQSASLSNEVEDAAIDSTVRYHAGKLAEGDEEGFARQVAFNAFSHAWIAANGTMEANASRDSGAGMRYARVPSGRETCLFCLMLASRGFAYRSASSAGGQGHRFHKGCDCVVVAGPAGSTLGGYDPQALYDRWQEGVDLKASERAERNGTSEAEERAKIMAQYQASSKRAKQKAKSAR